MFTSRAEYRLLLRDGTADLRLGEYGYYYGLIGRKTFNEIKKIKKEINDLKNILDNTYITPSKINENLIKKLGTSKIKKKESLSSILRRNEVEIKKLLEVFKINGFSKRVLEETEYKIKYEGFLKRQEEEIKKMEEIDNIKIPSQFSYKSISGLSNEIKEKLEKIKPRTLGQASRISGVTPSAISILMVYLKRI